MGGMLQDVQVQIRRMEYRPFQPVGAEDRVADVVLEAPPSREELDGLRLRVRQLEMELEDVRNAQQSLVAATEEEALTRGREAAAADANQTVIHIGEQMQLALKSFVEERDSYFTRVEHEVVQLALGIATRILHRESQIDPLLLSGAVRVALGQLSESTEACLRVPAAELAMWEEMLRLIPNLPLRPKVKGEEGFGPEECVLETRLGSVDLGVRAQLAEIERGFFDLLDQRPPSRTAENQDPSGLHADRLSE